MKAHFFLLLRKFIILLLVTMLIAILASVVLSGNAEDINQINDWFFYIGVIYLFIGIPILLIPVLEFLYPNRKQSVYICGASFLYYFAFFSMQYIGYIGIGISLVLTYFYLKNS